MENNILRLILWTACNRNCPKCVNKQYDPCQFPVCDDYSGYSTIILTGGEPMLNPKKVLQIVRSIRKQNPTASIILYTAKVDVAREAALVLASVDGIVVTLHNQNDVLPFKQFAIEAYRLAMERKCRVKVWEDVELGWPPANWDADLNCKWLDDCPIHENETIMRWNGLSYAS